MKHFSRISVLIVVLAGLTLLLPGPTDPDLPETATKDPAHAAAETTTIGPVRLFDGFKVIEDAFVVVREGRVVAVGPDIDLPAATIRIRADGQTLIPGLIDSHVHSFGAARQDAARFGVTTLLDMFTDPILLAGARDARDSLAPTDAADLFSSGMLATAPGGHGSQYGVRVDTLTDPSAAADWVSDRIAEGSDYIKIIIEPLGGRLPTLDRNLVEALVKAAHDQDRLAVAHATRLEDAQMALAAGVDGLVHLFHDRPVTDEFIDQARARGVFIVPTAIVMGAALGVIDGSAILNDDSLRDRFSQAQRQTLAQPGWGQLAGQARWELLLENLRRLHAAGVPLLAGSDAPNPGTAHGISLHLELALLVEAGLTPAEALMAATTGPASHFDLGQRGCLQPGCRADMALVDGDPTVDISASRQVRRVWKNGREIRLEHTPGSSQDSLRASKDLLHPYEMAYWQAAGDDFLGGNSTARLVRGDTSLAVLGEVRSGSFFPYAGALWMAAATPMQAVSLGDRKRLTVEVHGQQGPYQIMIFSGESEAAQPIMLELHADGDRHRLEVDIEELAALDRGNFRALGVFATGQPRPVDFSLVEVRLE